MVYETLDNRNMSDGMTVLLVYANDLTGGLLVSLILFAFFLVVMLGSYYSQQRVSGTANFPGSFAVAGYVTTVLAVLMSLVDGFVPSYTIIICVVVSVLGTLWLFMDKN